MNPVSGLGRQASEPVLVNLGCGFVAPKTWVNVDSALGAKLAKVPILSSLARRLGVLEGEWDRNIFLHDLTKPLPFAANSVNAFYSSHTLEHLSQNDGTRLLGECLRCLLPGARVRIVVPDLEVIVSRYTAGLTPATSLLNDLWATYPRYSSRTKTQLAKFFTFPHVTMYDKKGLENALLQAGFVSVQTMPPQESSIPKLLDVEPLDRTTNAIVMEGVKPD